MQISVLIPTYNSQDSLDLCIRSCIEGCSDLDQIEIIVGDDNIPGINSKILEKWKDKIEVLTFGQNVGLPHMTNLLVYQSNGEWVLIVNDDNVFCKNWFDKSSKYFEKRKINDGIVVAFNQIEPYTSIFEEFIIKDLGRDPKNFNLEEFWKFEESLNNNKYDLKGGTLPIFMKKTDFMKVGGWDINYPTNGVVADVDFFYKCQLSKLDLIRDYSINFYHFVSLSTPTSEEKHIRYQKEKEAWGFAQYKWKGKLKHYLL